MEPMNTLAKTGIMARLRNRRGFSLVEMAIVLVIIGVIIGAIIKGQDLIVNSRAKQVSAAVSTWRNLAMAHLDRNGKLPGDGGKTGIISVQTGYSSATKEIQRFMTTAPPNPVTIGSMVFYVYFGNTDPSSADAGRNIIALCKDAACKVPFTKDELEIVKVVDTGIDGSADAANGVFRGVTAFATTPDVSVPSGYAYTTTPATFASTATLAEWDTTYVAAIWAFDRPF